MAEENKNNIVVLEAIGDKNTPENKSTKELYKAQQLEDENNAAEVRKKKKLKDETQEDENAEVIKNKKDDAVEKSKEADNAKKPSEENKDTSIDNEEKNVTKRDVKYPLGTVHVEERVEGASENPIVKRKFTYTPNDPTAGFKLANAKEMVDEALKNSSNINIVEATPEQEQLLAYAVTMHNSQLADDFKEKHGRNPNPNEINTATVNGVLPPEPNEYDSPEIMAILKDKKAKKAAEAEATTAVPTAAAASIVAEDAKAAVNPTQQAEQPKYTHPEPNQPLNQQQPVEQDAVDPNKVDPPKEKEEKPFWTKTKIRVAAAFAGLTFFLASTSLFNQGEKLIKDVGNLIKPAKKIEQVIDVPDQAKTFDVERVKGGGYKKIKGKFNAKAKTFTVERGTGAGYKKVDKKNTVESKGGYDVYKDLGITRK